jgi:hypothetical protein
MRIMRLKRTLPRAPLDGWPIQASFWLEWDSSQRACGNIPPQANQSLLWGLPSRLARIPW